MSSSQFFDQDAETSLIFQTPARNFTALSVAELVLRRYVSIPKPGTLIQNIALNRTHPLSIMLEKILAICLDKPDKSELLSMILSAIRFFLSREI
jgi:hypothetical protein